MSKEIDKMRILIEGINIGREGIGRDINVCARYGRY
jgi:hypothetical protein